MEAEVNSRRMMFRSEYPVPVDRLAAYHFRPGAFRRITPRWRPVRVIEEPREIRDGGKVRVKLKAAPGLWRPWHAEFHDVQPGVQFADRMLRGDLGSWDHTHRFVDLGPGRCALEDEILWSPPFGAFGRFVAAPAIIDEFHRMFRYRHTVTANDLTRHFAQGQPANGMHVLISGATGAIGGALVPLLEVLGHTVYRLTRSPRGSRDVGWNPSRGEIDLTKLEQLDAVIHLAGEPILGRWTEPKKRRILESREQGTRLLAEAAAAHPAKPSVFITASGTNYYPSSASRFDEAGPQGRSFLAGVVGLWEEAAAPARAAGMRVVHLRTGMVLGDTGGALAQLAPIYKLGLGGPVGRGRHFLSWIALDDLVDLYARALVDDRMDGPINAVAPEPVSHYRFAQVLGRVLRRPALLPVPPLALKVRFGQMAREVLLNDQRVIPQKLLALPYAFCFPSLAPALAHLLGRELPPEDEFA